MNNLDNRVRSVLAAWERPDRAVAITRDVMRAIDPVVRRPMLGVAATVLRGNAILLIKRAGAHASGLWSCPGGWMEWGESPEQAMVRELREEVCLEVPSEAMRFISVTNDLFAEEDVHSLCLWFAVDPRVDIGVPAIGEHDKIMDMQWVNIKRLEKMRDAGQIFGVFESLMQQYEQLAGQRLT